MSDLRLVIFDVDGTLVDSQATIIKSMQSAFDGIGLHCPPRDRILSIVGLSLDGAMARLAPEGADVGALVEGYKSAYANLRSQGGATESYLYDGIAELIGELSGMDHVLLGLATGKSRRGVEMLLETQNWRGVFHTTQSADEHPSKPHPSMIYRAMEEVGTEAAQTMMIGDTSFDLDMAAAAAVTGIGVSWGYHDLHGLKRPEPIAETIEELRTRIWAEL
jgi:phosphoglycolate phosphatase